MVSMKITVMAVTLVTLCILATNMHAAYRFCCRRYAPGKFPLSDIKGFSLQKSSALCPVRAVIFYTKTRRICADPAKKQVMDYVSAIDSMARKVGLPKTVQGPDRITAGYVQQRDYITEKVRQEAESQPEDSFTSDSDKINKDGPLPMTLCKW